MTATQLDLFAEAEAIESDRLADQMPKLYASPRRGFHNRLAELAAWVESDPLNGFDQYDRSHAWSACLTAPADQAERCAPTVLEASLGCQCLDYPCMCVGGHVDRGACLHCDWEGPVRDDENRAVEDACDHAFPGWRTLPTVPAPPRGERPGSKATSRWIALVERSLPAGWLENGGPIRVSRAPKGHTGPVIGTRHVPNCTPFGGYEICVEGEENTHEN